MARRGKYDEARYKILEFLVTATDSGRCSRPVLMERFNLNKSSATDVLCSLREDGLIEIRRRNFNKIQSIEITETGRAAYYASQKKQEYLMPMCIKKYLSNRRIKLDSLFPIQKNFVDRGLINDRKNVSIFAYPGAGKTLLAEMAISKEIDEGGKVLYCTPYKALDWQKYADFRESFKIFSDVKIAVADGDSKSVPKDLNDAKIIISTYERVLSAIRSKESWMHSISLVCADEITLLADKQRGGTLDTILTLLQIDKRRRIITISSLVGNALEIAKWLGAETIIENRPVFKAPIEECIVHRENGKFYKWQKNGERTEIEGANPFEGIVRGNLASNMTTIVFTGTRIGAENFAKRLKTLHKFDQALDRKAREFFSKLEEDTSQVDELRDMLGYGIAYHHAGLQRNVRRFIEYLIRDGSLKTIVATTTLSHGVDYKIDSVIIDIDSMIMVKRNLPMYEYVNLKGRTGRPGKSKRATVYIVCIREKPEKIFTNYFLSSPEPIYPLSTLQESNIASMMLSEPVVDMNKISLFMERTFQHQHETSHVVPLADIADKLVTYGFLSKVDKDYLVTELGSKVNKSGLSTTDAAKVLSGTRYDVDALLEVASQIDIAKKLDLSSDASRVKMLKKWMKGKSLDEIRQEFGDFFDQDLIELASYTSLSLWKMDALFDDARIKKQIQKLRKKLRRE